MSNDSHSVLWYGERIKAATFMIDDTKVIVNKLSTALNPVYNEGIALFKSGHYHH
ncbi:hypothetical protein L0156_30205 [bacterium]|nr:hypothetical protein [bacterium]